MNRGKFITLEGIDGAGKSTHFACLTEFLRDQGREIVATREPGGTPLGERLRQLLLTEPMQAETETLLMFAARTEHLRTLIEPALTRGAWVVSDRFTDASFAYQSGGRGVAEDKLAFLEHWLQGSLQPDCTLLFDVPLDVSRQRLSMASVAPDRFEREKADFFARVRAKYLQRQAEHPGRIKLVDGSKPVSDIRKTVEDIIVKYCFK